jgi:hypothetical protein
MDNTEVDNRQGEYDTMEKSLDEQIIMIMVMLAELYPAADPGESCDI